jgi:hypothetical protein
VALFFLFLPENNKLRSEATKNMARDEQKYTRLGKIVVCLNI